MPYENVPTTNAPPIPPRADEYTFTFDITGFLPDGVTPRSTIDDLDMFSPENATSNKQMLDYLDRIVTKVTLRGQQLFTTIHHAGDGDGFDEQRAEGVRGKNIPYVALKSLMAGVGETIKEANDPGN
jgi:hypothetical protein